MCPCELQFASVKGPKIKTTWGETNPVIQFLSFTTNKIISQYKQVDDAYMSLQDRKISSMSAMSFNCMANRRA